MRINLQPYNNGAIYRNDNGTYTVETPLGSGSGATVELALRDLSDKLNVITELPKPKRKKKPTKKTIATEK